jgi:hypothetical protein
MSAILHHLHKTLMYRLADVIMMHKERWLGALTMVHYFTSYVLHT